MKELQFAVLVICIFFYTGKNCPLTSWDDKVWGLCSVAVREAKEDAKVKSPSISIALGSVKLRRQTAAVVKLRIENVSRGPLRLSEPSSFFLEKPEGSELKRITEGYTASARLWECLPKTTKGSESWLLLSGDSFECKIDLTKLNWESSKSSVYNASPVYPAGNLFHEVPPGNYNLFFSLQSPQELIEGLPRVREFRSNEISVSIEK